MVLVLASLLAAGAGAAEEGAYRLAWVLSGEHPAVHEELELQCPAAGKCRLRLETRASGDDPADGKGSEVGDYGAEVDRPELPIPLTELRSTIRKVGRGGPRPRDSVREAWKLELGTAKADVATWVRGSDRPELATAFATLEGVRGRLLELARRHPRAVAALSCEARREGLRLTASCKLKNRGREPLRVPPLSPKAIRVYAPGTEATFEEREVLPSSVREGESEIAPSGELAFRWSARLPKSAPEVPALAVSVGLSRERELLVYSEKVKVR